MRGRKPEGLGSADRKPFRGFDSYWTGCASQSEKQLSRAKQSETGVAKGTVKANVSGKGAPSPNATGFEFPHIVNKA